MIPVIQAPEVEDEGKNLSEPPIQDLEQDFEEEIPPIQDEEPASPERSV